MITLIIWECCLLNLEMRSKLRMNGKKCKLAVKQVKYLGHILPGAGIAVDPAKTEVITKWPTPNTPSRVKSFVGVANCYMKFIPAYSQRSAALRQLVSKNKHFHWGPEQEKSFQDLKSALVTPPILQYPDSNREFYPDTDASINGLSYVLG